MKLANKAVQVVIAAMLSLAASLMWPSAGLVISASHAHMHGVATEMSHEHSAHHDHRHDSTIQIDCEPSDISCCMMTLCHPALAIEPCHMAFMGRGSVTEPAMVARVFASMPDNVEPPPRLIAV